MRLVVLTCLLLVWLLLGGTCLPLEQGGRTSPEASLGIGLLTPTEDATVAQGASVQIKWSAGNLTGFGATVSLIVESRLHLSTTTLVSGLPVSGTGGSGTYTWDTSAYKGPYAIIARIDAGTETRQATAPGKITVDAPPTFAFTAPTGDVTFDPDDDEPVHIVWTAGDESGTATIGLDRDTDHRSGNEIIIRRISLKDPPEEDSFDWRGKDTDGSAVREGTYNLFATATDDINDVVTAVGLGQIMVLASDSEPEVTTPRFVEPSEDTEFLTTDESLTIEYEVNASDDVLIDLKVDTDDSHANGNERTILAGQFVEADTDPEPFEWDGNDTGDPPSAIRPGIYKLLLVIHAGGGVPQTIASSALVFRRTEENQPLIGLLEPASIRRVNPGDYIFIKWRDDDPAENALIRIVVADSNDPEAHKDDPPILTGRTAAEDGVRDTFSWQIPLDTELEPDKLYYIIAYIQNDDDEGLYSASVAAGRVILEDPVGQ